MGNLGDFGEGLTKGLANMLNNIPSKPFSGGAIGKIIEGEKNTKNANFSHSKKGGKIGITYH